MQAGVVGRIRTNGSNPAHGDAERKHAANKCGLMWDCEFGHLLSIGYYRTMSSAAGLLACEVYRCNISPESYRIGGQLTLRISERKVDRKHCPTWPGLFHPDLALMCEHDFSTNTQS
jgi:hypothetical protein